MPKHEVTKIFEEREIRSVWDDKAEKWYFSVVDVVAVLTGSANPRNYWKVLKSRLKKEGNQSVTNCNQLKLKSHTLSKSELLFFGNERTLKKNYLKPLDEKRIQ